MAEPLAGDILAGEHRLPVRVYFEDTDAGRIVYHARYLHFMERARSDLLRLLGFVQREHLYRNDKGRMGFAVKRAALDFKKPAILDDALEVRTRTADIKGASLTFAQDIWRGDEQIVAGLVTVFSMDWQGAPARLPKDMVQQLLAVMPVHEESLIV